jgi:ABC-type sugar transport system permease subunit
MSFLKINLLQPQDMQFVGIGNWVHAITDGLFWLSLFNVIYNQIIFITLSFIIAFAAALLLKKAVRFGGLFRTIYFLPVVTSVTASMVIFSFLVDPNGFIQTTLVHLGLMTKPIYWTFTKWLPMPILAVFSSWKWFGVQTIILLGGLYAINQELYEAAEVDGAGPITKLFKITIPQLNRQIVFILSINIINGLQMFTEVYMNFDLNGGPYHSGLTPVLYLYQQGFDKLNMGYAATLGLLLAIVIYIVTTLQMKITERED